MVSQPGRWALCKHKSRLTGHKTVCVCPCMWVGRSHGFTFHPNFIGSDGLLSALIELTSRKRNLFQGEALGRYTAITSTRESFNGVDTGLTEPAPYKKGERKGENFMCSENLFFFNKAQEKFVTRYENRETGNFIKTLKHNKLDEELCSSTCLWNESPC